MYLVQQITTLLRHATSLRGARKQTTSRDQAVQASKYEKRKENADNCGKKNNYKHKVRQR